MRPLNAAPNNQARILQFRTINDHSWALKRSNFYFFPLPEQDMLEGSADMMY